MPKWNTYYAPWQEKYTSGASTHNIPSKEENERFKGEHVKHSHTSGWMYGDEKFIEKKGIVIAPDGHVYTYNKNMFSKYLWFRKRDYTGIEDIEKKVLGEIGNPDEWEYHVEPKGGHIKKLAYNAEKSMMCAWFETNNDTCVYFNVPMSVYAELEMLARSDSMQYVPKGKGHRRIQRHTVGVRFWEIVRVYELQADGKGAGHIRNSKYDFQYIESGGDGGTGNVGGTSSTIKTGSLGTFPSIADYNKLSQAQQEAINDRIVSKIKNAFSRNIGKKMQTFEYNGSVKDETFEDAFKMAEKDTFNYVNYLDIWKSFNEK